MMGYFGAKAKAIEGVWRSGTNLAKVNELTARGIPLEQAIKETWTATRAAKLRLKQVKIVSQEGSPGKFTKVNVLFEK